MIYHPLANESVSVIRPQPLADSVSGDEVLLVAEDEDCIRSLLCTLFAENGYTVLEAVNGVEALEFAKRHCQAIALLLTDVAMPLMGGCELADRLWHLHPQTKVLFMSGYTDDIAMGHGPRQDEVEFIQKPFMMSALLHKVRGLLDQASGIAVSPCFSKKPCSP